jgi:hypothetical protein
MPWLLFPLLVLAGLASYMTAAGFDAVWFEHAARTPPPLVTLLVAGALHAAWILCAAERRAAGLVAISWPMSIHFSRLGLRAEGFGASALLYALVAETILLALAASLAPPLPWAERLARWRRARADIAVQLRMAEGVVPWLRDAIARFVRGVPELPAGSGFRRLVADLTDADCRLHVSVARLGAPEHLRQSVITSGTRLLSNAERAASRLSLDLEQQALAAVAACRDECEQLPGLAQPERQALAKQCEMVLLDLAKLSPQTGATTAHSKTSDHRERLDTHEPAARPA